MQRPNYLLSPYLPVRYSDGRTRLIAPWQVTEPSGDAKPVGFAFADDVLNPVCTEMLAGFLQVFAAPRDEAEWRAAWDAPPTAEALRARFKPAAEHFDLYGPHAAFQDRQANLDVLKVTGRLFHTDPEMSRPVSIQAAMCALYAMQAHAPSGGRGHRNSLTGGGPLRTVPIMGDTLWQHAWALVLPDGDFRNLGTETDDAVVRYAWKRETRFTDKVVRSTHPASTVYFAMPRRFRLPEAGQEGFCPILGMNAPLLDHVRDQHGGADHPAEAWTHPLTPYSIIASKGTVTASSVKAASFEHGIGWNDRAGLVVPMKIGTDGERRPALIVERWRDRGRALRRGSQARALTLRLHAYGARCDSAKILGILDSVARFRLAPPAYETAVESEMAGAIAAVREVQGMLRFQVRSALGREAAGAAVGAALASLWPRTEAAADDFQQAVEANIAAGNRSAVTEPGGAAEELLYAARTAALAIFDDLTRAAASQDPVRTYAARRAIAWVHRTSKAREPLALSLPVRSASKAPGGKARKASA